LKRIWQNIADYGVKTKGLIELFYGEREKMEKQSTVFAVFELTFLILLTETNRKPENRLAACEVMGTFLYN
jgi:hypothetical protein